MESAGSPAVKLLVQQLGDLEQAEGGAFKLGGLRPFDRVWVQGTVKQQLAGTVRVDDGTGEVDCNYPAAKPQQGLHSCAPGTYVLVQGKLLARPAAAGGRVTFRIKATKLLDLSKCEGGAAQRAMIWACEVQELQRLLEADAQAEAAS